MDKEGRHTLPPLAHLHLFFFVLLALSLSSSRFLLFVGVPFAQPASLLHPSLSVPWWGGGVGGRQQRVCKAHQQHQQQPPSSHTRKVFAPPFLFISVLQLPPHPPKLCFGPPAKRWHHKSSEHLHTPHAHNTPPLVRHTILCTQPTLHTSVAFVL